MSKLIKQMEMDALKQRFEEVRDMVLMSVSGLSATADNQLRLHLRKKNIHLRMVKNSLARRVFDHLGLRIENAWGNNNTLIAWGSGSLSELSRELDGLIRKNDKIKVKSAVSEGQEISFDRAKLMPTKPEAVGRVIGLALSPASRLVSQILAPGARLAAQLQSLRERAGEQVPDETASAPAGG
jgi:large subunit ribosomal protein L10